MAKLAKNILNLPRHVAIIMDGNGRWAKQRGLKRLEGHRQGAENLEELFETFSRYKIPFVSLYAFSTENWRRPKSEIRGLFQLLEEFLEKKLPIFVEKNIQLRVSGDIRKLPKSSIQKIEEAVEKTKKNRRLVANFCINYGGQDEILIAAQKAAMESQKSKAKISKRLFEKHLYTQGMPPVDLLIRTGGEKRVSNFLLYQIAYAEFYFTEILWPDFNSKHLEEALSDYSKRVRKFGGILE